jgi:large repetitive protein
MVQAVDFAVRDFAGGKKYGSAAGDGQSNFIQIGSGDSVSLNLAKESIVAYEQQGNNLIIKLADGRAVVLSDYFLTTEGHVNHLYISSEGEMTEVLVHQSSDGVLFADYGPVSGWDKWSPLDDLRFTSADSVTDAAYASNEPAGMAPFIPGLLGGFGGAGVAAAAAGAAVVVAGSGSGGGSGSTGGGSGSGGGSNGGTSGLSVTINEGTEAVNHVETGAEYTNGVQIGGTSTPGATIEVVVNGHTQTTTVDEDGNWQVTFPTTEVDTGQYTTPVTVTATDGSGNSATITDTLVVDTVVDPFTHTITNTSSHVADTVLNADEAAEGLTVGGAVEAGSTVMVKLNDGSYHAATVTGSSWSYTFASSEITSGDLHTMTMSAIATDQYGNVSSEITSPVAVDTLVSNFAHTSTNTSALVADAVLNGGEAAQGLTIGGTVESGSTVMVKLGDGSYHAATVTGSTWSYTFASGEVTLGDLHAMQITAVATDAYGNVSTPITSQVQVDTLVSNFAHTHSDTSSNVVDAILNKVEADSGLTVGGTVESGSSVMVKLGDGSYHAAQVVNGEWSYTFASSEITAGDLHSMTLTAVATDAYGNVSAPITAAVAVDTVVSNFHSTSTPLAGDGILNANEAAAGMTVSGTAEVGTHIVVHLQNGSEMTTTSDASGNWSVVFDAAHLPAGEGASSLTVTATDIAGNVAQYDQSFSYDTVAPADPWVTNDAGGGNIMSGIATALSSDTVSYHVVSASDGAHELAVSGHFSTPVDVNGTSVTSDFAFFTNPVADGSYLVISDTDAAGNQSSTLYIRSTTGEVEVDLSRSGLSDFDFGTIDLTASHASLTLTEAQINSLTGADKSMTIAGAADDHVTLVGATDTHTTQTIHGETYHLYTLGSEGAQVLIDSDILVTSTGV